MMWSLATLFNRVEEEKIIPAQGTETKIKSVYKWRNTEKIQESHRWIFLINIVCKVHEGMKKLQNEKKNNKYIKYANCKKEKEVIYRLPNHNECNNRKKDKTIEILLYCMQCWKMLWQIPVERKLDRDGKIDIKIDIKTLHEVNKTRRILNRD